MAAVRPSPTRIMQARSLPRAASRPTAPHAGGLAARAGKGLALLTASCLLGACVTTTTAPVTPQASPVLLPDGYRNALTPATPQAAPGATAHPWWRDFGSPELDALMDRVIANNHDLRIATLQLAQTKLRHDQAIAAGKPTLSAPLRVGTQAPGGQVGSVPVSGSNSDVQVSYQASLQGNWRWDVWGEQAALRESAEMQVWRAAHQRENVQRLITAELAHLFIRYLSANDALALTRQNLGYATQVLQAAQQRMKMGEATSEEIEHQRVAVANIEASLPGLEQQREDARNGIAFLVGTVPSRLELKTPGLAALHIPPPRPSLPSALLLQRPDVRLIEARLKAAQADIAVARARLLPPVDLSAQAGASSLTLAGLLQPQALFWNTIAGLTVSIFDGGRKQSETEHAQAVRQEMVETYARTLLQAVREVEGALVGLKSSARRLQSARQVTQSADNVVRSGEESFRLQALDIAGMLEARKNQMRSLDGELRTRAEYLQGYVQLFQALGGAQPEPTDPASLLRQHDGRSRMSALAPSAWTVELAGLQHHTALGATWRDMRQRFGLQLRGRDLVATLDGALPGDAETPQKWYRLSIQDFPNQADAERFCAELRDNQQQCRPVALSAADDASRRHEFHLSFDASADRAPAPFARHP